MSSSIDSVKWLIMLLIINVAAVSYNQPKICPNATWNQNGIIFAKKGKVGEHPRAIFINRNNTIFIVSHTKKKILIWSENNTKPDRTLNGPFHDHASLFVTINGDIYYQGQEQGRIYQWVNSSPSRKVVKNFGTPCHALFIDINNTLYCSAHDKNKIIAISLNDSKKTLISIAGTNSAGSSSKKLDKPFGIFVDTNFDLYVADHGNNRIQLFRSGQMTGKTVAGKSIPDGLELDKPTDVVLDSDDYLFIADKHNNRIIRSSSSKFQCVVGCTGKGSPANKLNHPHSIRLDSYGNIFVADTDNHRIQKFTLVANPCEPTTTTTTITTTTTTTTTTNTTTTTITTTTTTTTTTRRITTTTTTAEISTTAIPPIEHSTISSSVSQKQNESMTTEQTSIVSTEASQTSTIVMSTIEHLATSSFMTQTQSKYSKTANKNQSITTIGELTPTVALHLTTMINKDSTLMSNNQTEEPSPSFIPKCQNSTVIGPSCNIPNSPCDMFDPCRNDGSCFNNGTNLLGYFCSCPDGFNGSECQYDYRRCKPNTCWNDGKCDETLNTTSPCLCAPGWKGDQCEIMIDYCFNISCENNAVCRPLLLNYACECLGDSYSGRHCEIVATKIIIYKMVSKSFAYIAIIAMSVVVMFIVIMDILKYCFGIDPTHEDLAIIRRKNLLKKRKLVIQRFIYVNAPPSAEEPISTIEETAV